MKKEAVEYFMNGYSCSESIIKAGIAEGLVKDDLLPVATSFSGGMCSGCLCGAVAGSQMIIGALTGKNDKDRDGKQARIFAKQFVEEFKEKNKVTCCKILTKGFEMHSPERKAHCRKMVEDSAEILEALLELNKTKNPA